jgi:hypothetical protein
MIEISDKIRAVRAGEGALIGGLRLPHPSR